MGLIRSYSRSHPQLDWNMGDPGFGKWFKRATRIPRGIRKFQPGKALASIAPAALGFIPGVGGLLNAVSQRFGVSPGIARQILQRAGVADFEMFEGDPAPKKRKVAGSGTRAKAKAKTAARSKPKPVKPSKAKKQAKKGPDIDWNAIGEAATSLLPVGADLAKEVMRQAKGGGGASPDEMDLGAIAAGMPGTVRGLRIGGRRRHMNPTNVKALRRGIRRIEGFERIVKSIERAYPRMRRATGHAPARRGARGHRSGCACAVCRK